MIRVRVRVRPEQVMEQLDPHRAREAAAAVPGVRTVELWDERVSDALYVTLDVFAEQRSSLLEDGLRRALAQMKGMDAFLVVAYGDQVPVAEACPEDWAAATTVVA